jgi:hypothetical protein
MKRCLAASLNLTNTTNNKFSTTAHAMCRTDKIAKFVRRKFTHGPSCLAGCLAQPTRSYILLIQYNDNHESAQGFFRDEKYNVDACDASKALMLQADG